MDKLSTLSDNLLLLAHNPAAMQTLLLNQLEEAADSANNITLRDPTDPVVFLAEMGVTLAHSTIEACKAMVPKMYPVQAQTMDDLYRHMSDKDYVDAFAQPSRVPLYILLDVDSILSKAMPLEYAGVRKLVIPRDSQFSCAGYVFSIQYPIEIRVLPYGTAESPAFEVLWNTETQSPISPVSTNGLDWELGTVPNTTSVLLKIKLPTLQYAVTTFSDTTVGNNTFQLTRTFTNKFFYVRVWQKNNAGNWVEIQHTHSRDVYDPNVATALIQVVNQSIRFTIPSIYITNRLVSGEIRMDVYTTMGPITLDLSGYTTDQFSWTFRDLNNEYDSSYVNPLKTFSVFQLFADSDSKASGGRVELSFTELRTRLINNSVGARNSPITEKQLTDTVADYGLSLVNAIDYVTSRTYLLSATLPVSTLRNVTSPIGSVVSAVYFSWNDLSELNTVKINGNRITVSPDTIYRFDGSSLSIDKTMTNTGSLLSKDDLITLCNTTDYLFTPFYYVVDINNDTIDVRIYQLDKPALSSKRFISTNVSTELSVVTNDYQILKTSQGYVLRTITKSSEAYQALDDDQVFTQLSFTPRNSENVAYIAGTLVGKQGDERVWEFLLETNLDIDRNDELVLTNTRLNTANIVSVPTALTQDFNIFYGCTGWYPKNYERVEMDTILVQPSRDAIGITYEIFRIELGKTLSDYWRKTRAVTDTINYTYYEEDVLRYYESDVVEYENGAPKYVYVPDADPPLQFSYLHRKGDPVLDKNGNQELLYRKGDQVKDANGQPVISAPRTIKFRSEMAVFDAKYKYATSKETTEYLSNLIDFLVRKITVDLPALESKLLERTEAFFVPITTMGYIDARTEDGSVTPVNAEQQFTVSYYLTAANRNNPNVVAALGKKTSAIISSYLATHATISVSEIAEALRSELKDTILGVELEPMGPNKDMRMFTIMSDSSQITIGKKLTIEANGDIGLKDDIVTSYNRHDTAS